MNVDWGFWLSYIPIATLCVWVGWAWRGEVERDQRAQRARLREAVERAKSVHPAYKNLGGEWLDR